MRFLQTRSAAPLALVVAAGVAVAAPALAQGGSITAADRTFLGHLSRGNRAEVQLGQLAERKGSTDAVRSFGRRMAIDHGSFENQLHLWATENRVSMPLDLDAEQRGELTRLQGLADQDFDQEYIGYMVREHRQDVAEVQQRAPRVQNPSLQALATRVLPVLQDHLRVAANLAWQMGIAPRPGPPPSPSR
ncbi:MAG TPA: DUF4142 domain-containing protein [Polyangia bacterium]|jgi:putative membrane protein